MGVVLQMVQQNDEKHEAGHRRLRTDWRGHDERILKLEAIVSELRSQLAALKSQPADIANATIPARLLATIIIASLTIAGAIWHTGSRIDEVGLRVDQLANQMAGETKIEDERAKVFKDAIDSLGKAMEMRRLEIQQVSNSVQQLQRGTK